MAPITSNWRMQGTVLTASLFGQPAPDADHVERSRSGRTRWGCLRMVDRTVERPLPGNTKRTDVVSATFLHLVPIFQQDLHDHAPIVGPGMPMLTDWDP